MSWSSDGSKIVRIRNRSGTQTSKDVIETAEIRDRPWRTTMRPNCRLRSPTRMALWNRDDASNIIIHVAILILLLRDASAFIAPRGRPNHAFFFRATSSSVTTIHYDDFLPSPHADLQAHQVVQACLDTMMQKKEAGLEVCWNFSSDRCRVRACAFAVLVGAVV